MRHPSAIVVMLSSALLLLCTVALAHLSTLAWGDKQARVTPDCFACGACINACPTHSINFTRKRRR